MTELQKQPVWNIENSHVDLSNKLKSGLREVTDPELGLSVIQLGLIRNVNIDGEKIIIDMILTTPYCPYGPSMIDAIRSKAEEVTQKAVEINLGMDVWDFSMMEEGTGFDWGIYS